MRYHPRALSRAFRLMAFAFATASPLSSAFAQGTGTIRGRVVEIGTQRPVPDAQVRITGTTSGGVTNSQGEYVITAVPVGQREVVARRIEIGDLIGAGSHDHYLPSTQGTTLGAV